MQLAKAQHKIMLFHARLIELAETAEPVGTEKGTVVIGASVSRKGRVSRKENGESWFLYQRLGKDAIDIVSVRKLKMLCAARKPNLTTNKKRLDSWVRILFPANQPNDRPFSSDEITVRAFADRIKLDKERARYIIDYVRASELPTYNAISQGPASAARFTTKYAGLYYLYRHDLNEETRSNSAIVRATLSIRYPVPYKAYGATKRGDSRIRCKLVIPTYGDRKTASALTYDGFVGPKGRWHQFLFQARRDPKNPRTKKREDLILMYTEGLSFREGKSRLVRGVMMTQNQEHRLTPTVSTIGIVRAIAGRMKKKRVSNLNEPAKSYPYLDHYYHLAPRDEHDFMKKNAQVFYMGDPSTKKDVELSTIVRKLFKGWPALNTYGLHR
jgi:hypothetical protein